MRVLIIIPAYNEEKNIKKVVDNLINNYSQYDYVVINDGSEDGTSRICHDNKFNFIDLPVNLGLAGAVQTGMKYASLNKFDAAIQYDGDGQHNPEYIEILVRNMAEYSLDIVIGSRFLTETKPKTMRMIGSFLIQFLIKITTGKKINDPTSGMRLFGKKTIKEFAFNINYGPEPDTIAYLLRNNAKYKEVQVHMNERGSGESYLNFTNSIKYMVNICISIIFIQWFRERG